MNIKTYNNISTFLLDININTEKGFISNILHCLKTIKSYKLNQTDL